jgi:hypothetical protein
MGGFGTKRLKNKKKDKNRKGGGGGRVTPKGAAKVPKQPLALPGLDGSPFGGAAGSPFGGAAGSPFGGPGGSGGLPGLN